MKTDTDYNLKAQPVDAAEENFNEFVIDEDCSGERLDKALARLMPKISRSRLQSWIKSGAVKVNGVTAESVKMPVYAGFSVEVTAQPSAEDLAFSARDIPVNAVYEDSEIIVINKPAGLVVHPAAGHWDDTLLNGLLFHWPELKNLPRAGIVHRLDRDTTGLMVVAKTLEAQTDLVRQLQERTVKREYWALLRGQAPERTLIDRSIGRNPRNPLKFAVDVPGSMRSARTHLACVDIAELAGRYISWVACRLETGRTHQIRVHCESIGLPLLGDPLYRGGLPPVAEDSGVFMNRQALHASRLGLKHPGTGERMEWFVPPPEDLRAVMETLHFENLDQPAAVFDSDAELGA